MRIVLELPHDAYDFLDAMGDELIERRDDEPHTAG